jgi:hypothetical protein
MVIANLNRAAPRLARVVGAVQRAPALATIGAPARSQVMVDAQQQREELLVIQEGMAHCDGLRSWSKGDSPTAVVCSSSLREIFYRPSPNLIKSRASDISIRARAHAPPTLPALNTVRGGKLEEIPVIRSLRHSVLATQVANPERAHCFAVRFFYARKNGVKRRKRA